MITVMSDFIIHFLICNLFISGIIGLLLIFKKLLKNFLTNHTQYHLWFCILGLSVIPFMPFPSGYFAEMFYNIRNCFHTSTGYDINTVNFINTNMITNGSCMIEDFAVSVSRNTPFYLGNVLFIIWITGMFMMLISACKSMYNLRKIKQLSLPLQNGKVQKLYDECLTQAGIKKAIPVYSSAISRCPFLAGLFHPAVYLPIHLLSDYNETELKHMILHELVHYLHKDAIVNYMANIACILYWFNPVIWIAVREMRTEREIACDTSVLDLLDKDSYIAYGNTLINFTEKISLHLFPFTSGINSGMPQMRRRILNISSYETPCLQKRVRSMIAFCIVCILSIGISPVLCICAANENHYKWNTMEENITYADLSSYYGNYNGSFVLYDVASNQWTVYHPEKATTRVAPDSTYKIYSALFGLHEDIITPDNTRIAWDHTDYPFEAWDADQTLQSAMASSVNWYFQEIDSRIGMENLSDYYQNLKYGNELIQGNIDNYWMESSLKISPVEQVELLTKLCKNDLPFSTEDMNTVKESIFITSQNQNQLYGKTGTGRVNEKDVNGWFVGYVANKEHTYVFATNIQADRDATGTAALDITLSILSELNILSK